MTDGAAQLVVDGPRALLEHHYPNGRQGGLWVEGACPGVVGQQLELEVVVQHPVRRFRVSGRVAWARRAQHGKLPRAWGLDFAPDDQAVARLLAFARSELSAEALRHEARLTVALPVRLTHGHEKRVEYLSDLSTGGAFVRTFALLEPGELVTLRLRPPGSLFSLTLEARVAWARPSGPDTGLGLEFIDFDGTTRGKVLELIERLKR